MKEKEVDAMYSLIIIDDERKIRETLAKIIDWNSIGFEVSEIFSNATDALEYIESNPVDCVLADINMPHMDGIEFSKHICKHFTHIRIVFLTGYDNFSYAIQAFKNHVFDYLLKPTDPDELKASFENLKKELDFQKNRNIICEQYKCDFFNDLITGFYTHSDIKKELEKFELSENYPCSIVLLKFELNTKIKEHIQTYGKEAIITAFKMTIADSKNKFLDAQFLSFENNVLKYIFIFKQQGIKNAQEIFLKHCSIIEKNIEELFSIDTVSTSFENYSSINELNLKAFSKIEANSEIDNIWDLLMDDTSVKEQLERLLRLINEGNKSEIIRQLDFFFYELKDFDISIVKSYIVNLTIYVLKELDLVRNADIPDLKIHQNALIESKNSTELYSNVARLFATISNHIQNENKNITKQLIISAKKFISDNCCSNISLKDAAEHVHLSQNYFSKLFTQYTGQSFINYFVTCRINKAKELLITTDMKIYEISFEIGYTNLQHFSKLFKNITGMTPKEYRNKFFKGDK